jgi:hypothetical protein
MSVQGDQIRTAGDCLLWAVFYYRIKELAQQFGSLFPTEKSCTNFDKKWVGLCTFWAFFFSNSSGHPESVLETADPLMKSLN